MAITSWDGIANAYGTGKRDRLNFQKISSNGAASAAGRWHEMLTWTGVPGPVTFSGTAGVATQLNASTSGALGPLPNVSTDTRYLTKGYAQSPTATVVPSTLLLCDFLLYYPACVVTGTATTLNNAATLPRYTDGAGVEALIVVQSALGAASPALTLTYTDQSGNTGNALGAATVAMTASAIVSHISHAGTAANNYGPFLPLAAGDSGVRNVASVTFSAANTGTGALVLCKPLIELPLGIVSVYHNKDCLSQIPSLPVIPDGACLSWIFIAGGGVSGSTTFLGHTEYVWG